MKTVIEMAKEAGLLTIGTADGSEAVYTWPKGITEEIERFAELVRADQDEKYKWDVHSCGPTCTNAVCVAMREAVEAEREACAGLCDRFANRMMSAEECAAAIRARSNT